MRELNFRIGRKSGNVFRYLDKDELFNLYRLNPYDGSLIVRDNGRNVVVPRESYVIEQYTGLKDKNGKEIYEGDIIDFYGEKYEVVFRAGCFWAGYSNNQRDYLFFYSVESEVIGNIHENTELMKEEE